MLVSTVSGSAVSREAEARRLGRRRRLLLAGVTAITAALSLWMARLLGGDGFDLVDGLLLLLFTVTLPWLALGLCNALVGLALLLLARDPAAYVTPALARTHARATVRIPTAILVPVFNEEPGRVMRHLEATLLSLEATGAAAAFEAFLLSDSTDPAIAAAERAHVEALRARCRVPLHYRRRRDNAGHKTGNLWSWLRRHGQRFGFMLVLDADSLMSGPAILRLARVMEQNPELGILQALIVGLPNGQAFPRLFQIGMRHGMRAYSLGSAWWQGDCGPYWGHNAILRVAPFLASCRLPELPGGPPLGGRILSHDQVEAVLMRQAGYEVRLLPVEAGSYELNPPTVVEFVRRDLRWAQGNLQYLRLLPRLRTHLTGRVQLLLAVLMYVNAPAWLAFVLLATARALLGETAPSAPLLGSLWPSEPWLLLGSVLALTMAPKLAGTLAVLLCRAESARYGGRFRVFVTTAVELAFSLLLTPLMLTGQACFVLAMLAGHALPWGTQLRSPRRVGWAEALRCFRVHAVLGTLLLLATILAPALAPWGWLLGLALLAAVPFAVATAWPAFGTLLLRWRLAATPEELDPPPELAGTGYLPRSSHPVVHATALADAG